MPIQDLNAIVQSQLLSDQLPTDPKDTTKDFFLAFNEDFSKPLSLSAYGPNTTWIAHQPGFPDFGDAPFADPGQFKGPEGESWAAYILTTPGRSNKVLRMRLGKPVGQSTFWGGNLSSFDLKGNGYGAKYGYFEIRARFPDGGALTGGNGVWPSFWLVTVCDTTKSPNYGLTNKIEIDIYEYYGVTNIDQDVTPGPPTRSSQESTMTLHKWLPDPHTIPFASRQYYDRNPCGDYNRYGCLVDAHYITWYYNRQFICRVPTPPEHTNPLGVQVSMAQGGRVYGWPTPDPVYYDIDYVRVWEPNQVDTPIVTTIP